jgi:ADP-ribose pyrophosphatase YjhB (NUDIX family)
MLPEPVFLASLPRKRVTAAVLLFNKAGGLLIVKPGYRDGWLIPGGVVEAGESPRQAAIREVREEIGLAVMPGRLLGIDYAARPELADEVLHFIFAGGVLAGAQQAALRPQPGEIDAIRFATGADLDLLDPLLRRRVGHCLKVAADGPPAYLENGAPAGG